jgi:tetratricopeptide (TPR) repeat protein
MNRTSFRAFLFAAAALCASGFSTVAQSQGAGSVECGRDFCDWDYYSASSDPGRANRLYNEEKYHLQLGIERVRQRLYASALPEFLHILGVFPNHPVALDRFSQLCELWRDPKCSGQLGDRLARAIAVNPNAPGTYEVIGISQLRYKQPKQSVESCKKALELNPNSVNAHYTLGLAYFELKQYSLANEHAQKAYELGAPLPGLREKLRGVGQWKPNATPATAAPAPTSEPDKPAATK